jgi:purine-binding chemotaxis protein CheW
MRPLPIQTWSQAPRFILGMSMIRGEPVPVVDLAALLGDTEAVRTRRFVTVRAGPGRQVALAVEEVVHAVRPEDIRLQDRPPLLQEALPGCIDQIGVLDGALIAVLSTMHILPEEAWHEMSLQRDHG